MNKLMTTSFAFLALLSAACGTGASADSGNDDNAQGALEQGGASTSNAHLAAIAKCQKAHTKAADAAASTAAMVTAESNYTGCVKKANDAVVARIEKNLVDADSDFKGHTSAFVEAFRKSSNALCGELDKASANFGGSLSAVESVGCASEREAFLGSLIDTYVALGDESGDIKEDRAHHKSCYRVFDKRLDQAVANADMAQAVYALSTCVSRRTGLLATPVAKIEVQNDASAGPENAAADRVRAVTDDMMKQGGQLCALLNQAGENGTGTASQLTTASCEVRVAESVFASVRAMLDTPEGS